MSAATPPPKTRRAVTEGRQMVERTCLSRAHNFGTDLDTFILALASVRLLTKEHEYVSFYLVDLYFALGLSGCHFSLMKTMSHTCRPISHLTLIDGPASVEDCPSGGVVWHTVWMKMATVSLMKMKSMKLMFCVTAKMGKTAKTVRMVKMAMTEKRALPEKTAPTVPLFAIRMRELPE